MRTIKKLVIHCSASENGKALSNGKQTAAQVIDGWHKARGFKRDEAARKAERPELTSIGYHKVIDVDGKVFDGRSLSEIGAHASGHNSDSIGICLVGTDHFTVLQWNALKYVIETLQAKFQLSDSSVLGHRDLSPDLNGDGVISKNEWTKTCPGFEVFKWLKYGKKPL